MDRKEQFLKTPLVSIVIPTKDRYKYLPQVVDLIMGYGLDDLEVVVQDNSMNNATFLDHISKYKDDIRFVYNYTKEWVAIRDNLDAGIRASHGEYVCVIGDDDAVLSNIIECVRWMKREKIDVLIPLIIQYNWPDYITDSKNRASGILFYPKDTSFENRPQFISPLETLNESIHNGFINRGRLPLCYHGIASRKVLERVYSVGGHYSPGPSPDIAAGVALSLTAERYARTDYPVIISGASAMHGGGIRKLRGRISDIDNVPFLPKNAKHDWEKTLPLYWCGETVWPESAMKALRYMGRADLLSDINYNKIYFNFVCGHPDYFKEAINKTRNKVFFVFYFLFNYVKKITSAIVRRLKSRIDGSSLMFDKIDHINDIKQAAEMLNDRFPSFIISQ